MPRTLTALLAGMLLLSASARAADEAPPYRIVLPSGEAHELLPKTCGVCHKDSPYQFFVVASPTREGVEKALDLLRRGGAPEVAPVERPKNLHAATACPFCHLEPPQKGEDPARMQFRTLTGEAAPLGGVADLCEMCHPKSSAEHPKVTGWGDPAGALAAAGLPVPDGAVLCTTCHEMHNPEVGPAGTRVQYAGFVGASRQSYPHGNRATCVACHPRVLPEGAEAVFREPDPTRRCVRCHDEDHGRIHPVGVVPSDKTYPMSFLDYPLNSDGTIGCSTCHDHPCSSRPAAGDPNFLRGGPYVTFTDFCYRCHPKAGKTGLNPHDQLDERGNVVSATCTFCHKTAPSSDSYDPEELLYLRSPVELCVKCHDQGPHPGVNHLVEMPAAFAKRLEEYEKRHQVMLPLDASGRVVCTTCHNPHGKGVLRGEAALGAGEEHRWRVPSYAELCTPCHTRYD